MNTISISQMIRTRNALRFGNNFPNQSVRTGFRGIALCPVLFFCRVG